MSDTCLYNMFPIFAGGSSNEYINAMLYDESSDYILLGGSTTSPNFAPAQNQHGFLFALDSTGNWVWGNFFYNVSYAVSTVSGVKMSSANSYVTVMGVANSMPIIMLLEKSTGSIDTFLTI